MDAIISHNWFEDFPLAVKNDDDFLKRISGIRQELSSLLGICLLKGGKVNSKNPIEKNLAEILNLHKKNNFYNRDIELKRIFGFMLDLKRIKEHSEQNFSRFKKQLKKCNRLSQYVGIRFEVLLAAYFIKNDVDFINRESPDFQFQTGNSQLAFVETTSCHVTKVKNQDFYSKVSYAIDGKSKKRYAAPDTALVIDVTNIVHTSAQVGSQFMLGDVVAECKASIENTKYGAILFMFLFPNKEDGWLYSGGDSVIKDNASDSLKVLWQKLNWHLREPNDVEHGTLFCT